MKKALIRSKTDLDVLPEPLLTLIYTFLDHMKLCFKSFELEMSGENKKVLSLII